MALPFILLGTFGLLYFGALSPDSVLRMLPIPLAGNNFIDAKLKYQIITIAFALIVLAIVAAVAPQNARRFYRAGKPDAPAGAVNWLGIKPTDTWKLVGRNFSVIISLATGAFIYFNLVRGQSIDPAHTRLLPWILVLSLMNAFTEEAITRLGVVTALDGMVSRPVICIISALIFGIPHYFGIPGGIPGSLMAGFLGWLLAKSILETEGMFWAWLIHFLQDVIIFSGLFFVML